MMLVKLYDNALNEHEHMQASWFLQRKRRASLSMMKELECFLA